MKTFLILIMVLLSIIVFSANKTIAENAPKNIILMISDGCGYNQINSASIYQYGKTGSQIYDSFPIKLWVSTYPANKGYDPEKAWSWFNYVQSDPTDSAAAATAMATGYKTYNSAIGVDLDKNPIKNVSEFAKELGKAVGVVTSVEFSHATPASFLAHNAGRGKYEDIAQEMLLDSKADVIMGCGNPLFDNNGKPVFDKQNYSFVGGELVWDGIVNGKIEYDLDKDGIIENFIEDCDGDGFRDPWKLIQSLSDFRLLMKGDTPKRVIGVPQVFETLQYRRLPIADRDENGKIEAKDGIPVDDIYKDPIIPTVPSLQEMVTGALNVLDNDKDGFFLMIEGGAIDWASHDNSIARQIEEEIDFNEATDAVVKWVKTKSNWNETLIIITADHETGYLTGPDSGPDKDDPNDSIEPVWNPLINNGKGKIPGVQWNTTGHTNSLVPIFANGVGSWLFWKYANETDPVRGAYIENTEIAKVIFELWGRK